MAKKFKKGEKLGDVIGARRPILGGVLALAGAMVLVSLLGYAAGQEVYFKDSFGSFFQSTAGTGVNICGRVGATLCLLLIVGFGVGVWMFPTYLIWLSVQSFTRRPSIATKTVYAAMLTSIFLLPVLAAALQFKATGAILASAYFPCGWGGGVGSYIFNAFLLESVDVFGSALIAGSLYLVCLIIIFVDSPAEAAHEISGVVKKSPPVFVRVGKILFKCACFPFKFLFGLIRRKKDEADDSASGEAEVQTADTLLSPDGVQKVKLEPASPETETSAVPQAGVEEVAEKKPVPEDMFDARYSKEVEFSDGVRFGVLRDDDGDDDDSSAESSDNEEKAAGETSPAPEKETSLTESASQSADDEIARKREKFARLLEQRKKRDSKQGDGTFKVIKPEDDRAADIQVEKKRGDYVFPSVDLLAIPDRSADADAEDYEARMAEIVGTIDDFGVKVFPASAESGPVITRYELTLASGIRINKVAALDDEIAMKLKAESVRIIAPIPGKGTIGVEIPNRKRRNVVMRDIIESVAWSQKKAAIPIVLGKDVTGKPIVLDLAKMPHALIAGSTGSGKSVCINAIINSLLYYATPDDLRFILVDPKQVELQIYNTIPHMLIPVVSDAKKVPAALSWLCTEMERRYTIFSRANVRNISGFNAKLLKDKESAKAAEEMDAEMSPEERVAAQEALDANSELPRTSSEEEFEMPTEKLPYIVCIVDELADIMIMAGKDVDAQIQRLTAKARAAGIHLILATQRPSVDVITGVIKANLPFRIAFKTVSATDSRTILDSKGAEMLIGNGDLLYGVAGAAPVRAQGAFISDGEINGIVDALKVNGEPEYVEEVEEHIENYGKEEGDDEGGGGDYEDPMVARAIEVIRANKKASVSFLQRKLSIGYGRAAKIIDILEEEGAIGPDKGPGAQRDIYL